MNQSTTERSHENIREYLVAPATPTVDATVVADVGNARTAIMVQLDGQERPP